jgi:hypothetical protein
METSRPRSKMEMNLEVVVEMVSYAPFDMKVHQTGHK